MNVDLGNIQSSIVRSNGLAHGNCLLFQFEQSDTERGRNFLKEIGSLVTTADKSGLKEVLNVGFTYEGLQALGLPGPVLDSLPQAFTDSRREEIRGLVGDCGPSDPQHWWGGQFESDAVHCLLHMFADSSERLEILRDKVRRISTSSGVTELIPAVEGHSPKAIEVGWPNGPRKVHFGFMDGFSQPRIDWKNEAPAPDGEEPFISPEAFLIGYRDTGQHAAIRKKWFGDCTYGAFRWLRQDAAAFEAFLDDNTGNMRRTNPNASEKELKEWLAAKMFGRWRDGTPLTLSPDKPDSQLADKDFGYATDDPDGLKCPFTSHVRLTNPRDQGNFRPGALGGFDDVPRLIRRGAPFGPAWKAGENDHTPRGLAGMFLTGDLEGFNIVMSWMQRAEFSTLFDSDSNGNKPQDPVLGNPRPNNRSKEFHFKINKFRRAVASPLTLFVWTIGAATLLLPTKSLFQQLATGDFD